MVVVERLRAKVKDFSIGERIVFVLNGAKHPAEIVGLTKHHIEVEDNTGTVYRIRPSEAYKDNVWKTASTNPRLSDLAEPGASPVCEAADGMELVSRLSRSSNALTAFLGSAGRRFPSATAAFRRTSRLG